MDAGEGGVSGLRARVTVLCYQAGVFDVAVRVCGKGSGTAWHPDRLTIPTTCMSGSSMTNQNSKGGPASDDPPCTIPPSMQAAVLALNNTHATELSWIDAERLSRFATIFRYPRKPAPPCSSADPVTPPPECQLDGAMSRHGCASPTRPVPSCAPPPPRRRLQASDQFEPSAMAEAPRPPEHRRWPRRGQCRVPAGDQRDAASQQPFADVAVFAVVRPGRHFRGQAGRRLLLVAGEPGPRLGRTGVVVHVRGLEV